METVKMKKPTDRRYRHLTFYRSKFFNTGVNQKVLPVLSTETLLHIWLSTEYYGFRPSSTAVDRSVYMLRPHSASKTNANRIFISADSQRGIEHCF